MKELTLKLLVIDVDGTLTDSGIYYDETGNETKRFSTRDAAGFFAARAAGIKTMILTGRGCTATTRRMKELKVDYLVQGVRDKAAYLAQFCAESGLAWAEIGVIGDDLNDLPAMQLAGFAGCPLDSCAEVRAAAGYVSGIRGGYGAVRDIVEHLLHEHGLWEEAIQQAYGIGI